MKRLLLLFCLTSLSVSASQEQMMSIINKKAEMTAEEYLEEIFIRQVEVDNNEADDLIAYYCQIAKDEQIIIFSGDKDLTQLISETVTIKNIAGEMIINNSTPPNKNKESEVLTKIVRTTQTKDMNSIARFCVYT